MLFGNPLGWYAFLAVIPLIIFYLIRPRPTQQVVPSLMFFIKQQGMKKHYRFFSQLLRDLLFLLQLLAICALAFALTSPFIQVPAKVARGNTVVVLDVSASMQVSDGFETRFEKGVGKAEQYLGSRNSIILASHIPLVVLEDSGKLAAAAVLKDTKPRDTIANLGDAMFQAKDLLGGKAGKVVVVSDFSFTEGTDPLVAKRTLTAEGTEVIFINPSKEAKNLGVIHLDISKADTTAIIKNFNDKEEQVTINLVTNNEVVKSESKTILANSVELFNFNTLEGTSEIHLLAENDNLEVDNYVFISNPVKNIKVLLITKESPSVQKALEASPFISTTKADFPTIPKMEGFDIVIVGDASFDKDYPTFYRDLKNHVKAGKALIVTAESKSGGFEEMMPVSRKTLTDNSTDLIVTATTFTKHMMKERINIQKYYKAGLKEDAQVIMETYDEQPVLALWGYQEGIAVYYGVFDELSNFRNSIAYPIFWNELAGFLVGAEDIADFNVKTTSVVVKDGVQRFLDKAGIYDIDNKQVAANLLDERESNINYLSERMSGQAAMIIETDRQKQSRDLTYLVVALAFAILVLELLYVKFRGDL